MCGIVGVVNRAGDPVSPVVLQRMTNALGHRGPDSEGYFVEGAVGLGHRRLSIIDLSPAGHQPMATGDGSRVLIYNGEVYNFHALRLELEALGHQFRSRTDSEVVLHGLDEWGAKAIPRFNGMFAFALYDRDNRHVLLGRDRYGIKPLYYVMRGDSILFGSEIKSFFPHPDFSVDIDEEGLVEYFTFQNFLTDRTLFKDVRMVPAGSVLTVPLGCSAVRAKRYWDFSFGENGTSRDPGAYVEELDRLFTQAVNRQLVSDVPVGAYLSGGMDTGAITSIASKQLPELKTFTVGFDLSSASGLELGFDERAAAERLSYLCQTEHYEMVLKAGDMERVFPQLMWHLEEPRVGQSYPNFFAAKLAGSLGRVVLSGGGGDELFGGYPWRYYRAIANDSFDHYVDSYFGFWQRLVPPEEMLPLFSPISRVASQVDTREIFRSVFDNHMSRLERTEDYINHSLYFEAKTFLHGLLVMEDKLSMSHSLETRLPFLDNDLVDFATEVPVQLKLGDLDHVVRMNENDPGPKARTYWRNSRDGKLILRQAMTRHVPAETISKAKQGFSAPDASWFRGESIDYVRRRLLMGRPRLYDYLDRATVTRLVEGHLEGRHNRRLFIWSLLCFEQWCETFLDGRRSPDD